MTWLADLLGIRDVYKDGVALATRQGIEFLGSAWSVQDNPSTQRTEIRFTPSTVDYKTSVFVATTAALPANTRAGNVLTADANGAFPSVDGETVALGKRVLVKNESPGENNGIFDLTDAGSGSTPWVMTRSTDADESNEVTAGMLVPVEQGTANGDKTFRLTTNDPITLNVDPLQFSVDSNLTAPVNPTDDGKVAYASGGDLAYASNVKIVSAGVGLAAGHIEVGTGTMPTSGGIRWPNGEALFGRDTATNDAKLISWSSDDFTVGEDVHVDNVRLRALQGVSAFINTTLEFAVTAGLIDCQDNEIRTNGFLAFGSPVATTGDIRADNPFSIYARTDPGGANARLFEYDVNEKLYFGEDTNVTDLQFRCSTAMYFLAGGAAITISGSNITLDKPNLNFGTSLTPVIKQNTISAGLGKTFSIRAQDCSTGLAGDLAIRPGHVTTPGTQGKLDLQDHAGVAKLTVMADGGLGLGGGAYGTTGAARVADGFTLHALDNGGSNNRSILDWGGVATDDLYIGDAAVDTVIRGLTTALFDSASNAMITINTAKVDIGGVVDFNNHAAYFTRGTQSGTGTKDIDWSAGNKYTYTFGAGNVTFTFTDPTSDSGTGAGLTLRLIQDSGGNRTASWPASVKWVNGSAPTLSTGSNAVDEIFFDWDKAASAYYGTYALGFA